MIKKSFVRFLLIIFAGAILIIFISLYTPIKQVSGSKNISKSQTADLDKDSILEKYSLANGRLTITKEKEFIWQSPDSWWIDDFVLADATNDGIDDINLSVWKAGNFGDSKPFWVKENDLSIKNHFFIFNLTKDGIKPIWQSSNLERPNCEFLFEDIDKDNKKELIVLEGTYNDQRSCQGKYLAIFKWNEWGFTNLWRSKEGKYEKISIKY